MEINLFHPTKNYEIQANEQGYTFGNKQMQDYYLGIYLAFLIFHNNKFLTEKEEERIKKVIVNSLSYNLKKIENDNK